MEWISVKDRLPEIKKGQRISDRVFAWCDNELKVMALAIHHDDDNFLCIVWCNCYADIEGDAEFDDNYYPTHWMPLPEPPNK